MSVCIQAYEYTCMSVRAPVYTYTFIFQTLKINPMKLGSATIEF